MQAGRERGWGEKRDAERVHDAHHRGVGEIFQLVGLTGQRKVHREDHDAILELLTRRSSPPGIFDVDSRWSSLLHLLYPHLPDLCLKEMKILIWKESNRYFRMVVLTEVARFSRLVNKMSRLEVRKVRRKRGIVPTTRNGAPTTRNGSRVTSRMNSRGVTREETNNLINKLASNTTNFQRFHWNTARTKSDDRFAVW
jgi:hypothetical protein